MNKLNYRYNTLNRHTPIINVTVVFGVSWKRYNKYNYTAFNCSLSYNLYTVNKKFIELADVVNSI